ncbi:MAG: hybrid sensor histidine kinase/response regulator [Anaerolineae bacterium]|nr:hybrid sensor histidine kinase/response regulator [Anaerolineae bacterium]
MSQQTQETILIVDDNPTNLGVLFDYLQGSGFKVLVAEDGEVALQRAGYTQPDIILLDVMMPGWNGFETCQQLKDNEETRDIPVIFMTALSDAVDKVRGLKLGAVDYVTKPLQHEEVLARINTHLTIRKLQKNLREQNERLQMENIKRRQIEEELRKQNKELDAFVHTVAHDLQNPLGMVISYAHVLFEDLPKMELAEALEVLDKIKQAGRKMDSIIENLLLLAGVRRGEVDLKPLDMAEIVAQGRQRLGLEIEKYQGEIIQPQSWPPAKGYAPWVEEVWVNYLSNGLKYGGHPPRLELGATPQPDGMIRFWIKDNGPGITPAEQACLFVEFVRLDELRVAGHGLGLSIVRRIVEKLGGQVGVESTVGAGSTFYFTLPGVKETG